jgi:predicted AAA+ superfamily ATPase
MRSDKERNEIVEIFKRRVEALKDSETKNELLKQIKKEIHLPFPDKVMVILANFGLEAVCREYTTFIIPLMEGYRGE